VSTVQAIYGGVVVGDDVWCCSLCYAARVIWASSNALIANPKEPCCEQENNDIAKSNEQPDHYSVSRNMLHCDASVSCLYAARVIPAALDSSCSDSSVGSTSPCSSSKPLT
jgi:hypothetical protein